MVETLQHIAHCPPLPERVIVREKVSEPVVDLNIVILPDIQTTQTLQRWSDFFDSHFPNQTSYSLNPDNAIPHFSLYSARYPIKNWQQVYQEMVAIAARQTSFQINAASFSEFSGFLFLDAIKSKSLMQLHQGIVNELNPLREGHLSAVMQMFLGQNEEQDAIINQWGYVSVSMGETDRYKPHFSLTHFPVTSNAKRAINCIGAQELSFMATRIAIAPFGRLGTCPEIITELSFGK